MVIDLFFWSLASLFVYGGIAMNVVFFQTVTNTVWSLIEPTSYYGLAAVIIGLSLMMEDDDRIFWAPMMLYSYMLYRTYWPCPFITDWHDALFIGTVYVFIGIVWSFIKLWLFIRSKQVSDYMESYQKTDPALVTVGSMWVMFRLPSKIRNWIIYWPISIINTCTYDVIVVIWENFFNNVLKTIYFAIIRSGIRGPIDDLYALEEYNNGEDGTGSASTSITSASTSTATSQHTQSRSRSHSPSSSRTSESYTRSGTRSPSLSDISKSSGSKKEQ